MTPYIIIYNNKFPIFYPHVIVSMLVPLRAAELWRRSNTQIKQKSFMSLTI